MTGWLPEGTTTQSEVGSIRRLVLKHTKDGFISQESVDRQWERLAYTGRPDFAQAIWEYDRFAALFEDGGSEITFLPEEEGLTADSIYVRDATIVCDRGVILCRMGKDARRGEPAAQGRALENMGVPIVGEISGEGRIEGGDVLWLDRRTVAVGRGYRTNAEGIRQLRGLLADSIEDMVVVGLPHFRGPGDVFHLMSILSLVDHDVALVHSRLMPVPFREHLLERGFRLVEVPEEEFDSQGPNAVAIAPGRCVLLEGNPRTQAALEETGVEVLTYEGLEISAKGCGGPTCLTRPLERSVHP